MKKISVIISLAVCILIFAASCSIDNNNNTNPQQGNFLIANISPNSPPLNVFINGSTFGSGLAYGIYTPYYNTTAGSYAFSFTDPTSANVLNNTVSIAASTTYSYFVIDSFSKLKAAFIQDNIPFPSTDSVYIRFFNFSPDAQPVNLYNSTTDTTLYSTRFFNDQAGMPGSTNFNRIKSGIYNLQLQKSDSTVLASKLDTLAGGHVYTIFAKGFAAGIGTQAVGIGQIQNY